MSATSCACLSRLRIGYSSAATRGCDSGCGGASAMPDLPFLPPPAQMRRLSPYVPRSRGIPRVDDRRVPSRITLVIKRGLNWRDAPPGYGPTKTLSRGVVRSSSDGRGRPDLCGAGRRSTGPLVGTPLARCRGPASPGQEHGAAPQNEPHARYSKRARPEPFSHGCEGLQVAMSLRRSSAVKVSSAVPMAFCRASRVAACGGWGRARSVAKSCSIGFRSGLYGGRKRRRQ